MGAIAGLSQYENARSENVHGNREAQRLAIQYRKAKEKQLKQEWNKKRKTA